MILKCPNCSTNYELSSGLPEGGTKVRCTSCANVWHATDADLFETEALASASTGAEETNDSEEIPAVSPIENDALDDLDFNEIDEPEVSEDNSQDDIDGLFDEPEASEDNSQDDIDGLFDEPAPEEDNSQDDIDGLFDEPAPEEDNSQDDIDGLFDEPAPEEDNSQDDIDGLFDEPEPVAASDEDGGSEVVDPSDEPLNEPALDKEKPVITVPKGPFWKRLDPKTGAGWCAYGLAVGLIGLFMIFARVSIVSAFPAMGSLYSSLGMAVNVRGVMFTNVNQHWDIENKVIQLKIEGEMVNLTNKYRRVPSLIVTAYSEKKREVFSWVVEVRKKPLLPGEKALFSALIPAPPIHGKYLLIKFE